MAGPAAAEHQTETAELESALFRLSLSQCLRLSTLGIIDDAAYGRNLSGCFNFSGRYVSIT